MQTSCIPITEVVIRLGNLEKEKPFYMNKLGSENDTIL